MRCFLLYFASSFSSLIPIWRANKEQDTPTSIPLGNGGKEEGEICLFICHSKSPLQASFLTSAELPFKLLCMKPALLWNLLSHC